MNGLALEISGALMGAALFGAVLLWMAQAFWGRFAAPLLTRAMALEIEALREDQDLDAQRVRALEEELDLLRTETEELHRTKRRLTATLDARNRALQTTKERLTSAELTLNGAEDVDLLRGELRQAVQERDALRGELRDKGVGYERLRTELEVLHGIHDQTISELQDLKSHLHGTELGARETQDSRAPAYVMVRPQGPRDDLQRLEGVSARLERALNRLGLYHFHQIARFQPSDVEWVAGHVDGVPERVIRDSWITQAADYAGVRPATEN